MMFHQVQKGQKTSPVLCTPASLSGPRISAATARQTAISGAPRPKKPMVVVDGRPDTYREQGDVVVAVSGDPANADV